MCRIVFFVSKEKQKKNIRVEYLISDAVHSLSKQSYKPPYLPGLDLNKQEVYARNPQKNLDGFGVVYKKKDKMISYKSKYALVDRRSWKTREIVAKKISGVRSDFMMAVIRNNNFKHIHGNNQKHVSPYNYGSYYFIHNGGFNFYLKSIKKKLIPFIKPKILKDYKPVIDSQYLFCYLISELGDFKDYTPKFICGKISKSISKLDKMRPTGYGISLVFILSDVENDIHIALRYRICKESPPALYYNADFRKGYILASEPINHQEGWKLLDNNLLIIKNKKCRIYDINKTIQCKPT